MARRRSGGAAPYSLTPYESQCKRYQESQEPGSSIESWSANNIAMRTFIPET